MAVTRIGVQPVIIAATSAMGRQTYRIAEVVAGVEAEPGVEVTCTNDLSVAGNVNLVHWQADADSVRVYRSLGGVFESVTTVEAAFWIDDGSTGPG